MSEHYTTVGPVVNAYPADAVYELTLMPQYPHTFVGVIPCDAAGEYDGATAGTAAFKVMTANCPGVWQIPVDSTVDLTVPGDVSFGGNITKVQVTISGLTGAAYTRAHASQNLA